ncbi:MAG: glycerophosphodiester phosphodiesterase [Candidatus Thorarchaeota archaeon]
MTKPLVIGHKGSPIDSPENTLQSFESAINQGSDMVELDLQESSDGYLVVIHDYDVKRVSNQDGHVSEMTLHELKSLDLGDSAVIPTLEEVLDLARGRIKVNIELKVSGIESAAISLVKQRGMMEDVIFSSFYHGFLLELKEIDQTATTAIVYNKPPENVVSYAIDFGAAAINPLFNNLESDTVREAHNAKLNVFPWTINDENTIEEYLKMGVDGIITDIPGRCRDIVDRLFS